MTIPTEVSLHGFIASPPELNFTGNGHARFYARRGVEQIGKEVDARFKVGDQSVASGYP